MNGLATDWLPSQLAQGVSAVFQTLFQPVSQAKTQTCSLLAVAGMSLSVALPTQAANLDVKVNANLSPLLSQSELLAQRPKRVELTLVSYAVTKEAYSKIIPKFQAKWKREKGQDVIFRESYGGSGSQARAVIDGLEADVVALAIGLDVERIEKAGLIRSGWEREAPNEAIVTRSVVAIVTRPGNPKGIRTWTDLAKPGVSVITANPKTSGVARWNFLALWGSVSQTGGTEAKARGFVTQVFRNVPILPRDAREATDIFFKKDQGDVLLNYENEVILAAQKGETGFSKVIPPTNISIDNPVAVVDRVVDKRGTRQAAEAFVQFLYTPESQREFARVGFRPVNSAINKEFSKNFSKVSKLVTAKQLGGWDNIQSKFFADGAIFDQIQSRRR
ncbi:MAG: sulfate ABC transporter substrate-binding protein [Leptolyngbyaceae cyanobacterium bins.59]|nr:sulfate ABC transporter substrate-binding protein [Leptolyngbyaceae cyanobacterium bins.59]